MNNGKLFTEAQITETFGKAIAVRLKCLTGDGQAIFDEFKFNGQSYLGGYDLCKRSFYILNADTPKPAEEFPQSKGQIITIRTKPEKKAQPRRLEVQHT
jgi:hypothetical protein